MAVTVEGLDTASKATFATVKMALIHSVFQFSQMPTQSKTTWLKITSTALLAGLLMSGPLAAQSDDFAIASQAYKARDFETALAKFESAADSGNINAQWMTGLLYRKGRGTDKDPARAFGWFAKAAESGHAGAQGDLAEMLLNGEGVERDDGQAAFWFAKATDGGDADARMSLAGLYEQGRGVDQDYRQAADLYLESAVQGNTRALYKLGDFAQAGHAAEKSLSDARNWFQIAAERGHAASQERIGYYREMGLGGLEQDWFEAAQSYRSAALKGLPSAQYRLGMLYHDGRGVMQNSDTALRWLSLANRRTKLGGALPNARHVYRKLVSGKSAEQKRDLKDFVDNWRPKTDITTASLGPWQAK